MSREAYENLIQRLRASREDAGQLDATETVQGYISETVQPYRDLLLRVLDDVDTLLDTVPPSKLYVRDCVPGKRYILTRHPSGLRPRREPMYFLCIAKEAVSVWTRDISIGALSTALVVDNAEILLIEEVSEI